MSEERLTSADAAEFLNVGVSTIKRWADEGIVPCIRTAGGHRRFERSALTRHAARAIATNLSQTETARWVDTLLAGGSAHQVAGALHSARHRVGAWWRVARELGLVLAEIGRRWAEGELSIVEEHSVSERLMRGLTLVMESMPTPPNARCVLLLTAEGEEHTLGLALVELCAREVGWVSQWCGRGTPLSALEGTLNAKEVDLVAVSASTHSQDAKDLAAQCTQLEALTEPVGAMLILGGGGAWPSAPKVGIRVRRFEALHELLYQRLAS
jgi:MerR family transcriptional regulator, light-induced transcriptional regulator